MRLTLVCATAVTLPTSIVIAATAANMSCNWGVINDDAGMSTANTAINALKAAALPAVLIKAVTTVGEPSYTSGAH